MQTVTTAPKNNKDLMSTRADHWSGRVDTRGKVRYDSLWWREHKRLEKGVQENEKHKRTALKYGEQVIWMERSEYQL